MAKKKPSTKDGVPRALERSGELCLAFANTAAPRVDNRSAKSERLKPSPDDFDHYGDLVDWGWRMGTIDNLERERLVLAADRQPEEAKATLTRALLLRDAIMRVFTAVAFSQPAASKDLDLVNDALDVAQPFRRIVGHGKAFRWQWYGDEEAFDRMLWPVATSAADLLLSDDLRWVRQCAGQSCKRLFVDRASHRRVWCDMNTCGSRPKGRRHYKRTFSRRVRHKI